MGCGQENAAGIGMPVSCISSANVFAGISGFLADSANSHAIRITKAGLRNSDGWMLTPMSTIQRRAPLTSAPMKGVSSTIKKLTANTRSAMRRM